MIVASIAERSCLAFRPQGPPGLMALAVQRLRRRLIWPAAPGVLGRWFAGHHGLEVGDPSPSFSRGGLVPAYPLASAIENRNFHDTLLGICFEAIDCLRDAVWATKGHYEIGIAASMSLRRGHRIQFISHAFQDVLRARGIEPIPSSVRQPEDKGRVERFIPALKEQLLWLRLFGCVAELDAALCDPAQRFNQRRIIEWIGYRTAAQHRRDLLVGAA
jgi:hypothetical protein